MVTLCSGVGPVNSCQRTSGSRSGQVPGPFSPAAGRRRRNLRADINRSRLVRAWSGHPRLRRGTTKQLQDKADWLGLRDMTEAAVHSAALADPDGQPLTDEAVSRMRRVPRARTLRRALGLTQEEFATRYQIPIGTLRDWEQGRSEPDQPDRAYLKAIAGNPDAVRHELRVAVRETT